MTGPKIYKEIESVIQDINKEIKDNTNDLNAGNIISYLSENPSSIEVIEDNFEPIKRDIKELKNDVEYKYNSAYGLDGSTTKDMSYNNGLIISISVASTSVTGSNNISDITRKGSVCITAYFNNEDIDLDPNNTDDTAIHFIQFPNITTSSSGLSNWITNISRTYAEGSHFKWTSKSIDGPMFIDGPLFPRVVLSWVLDDQINYVSNTPLEHYPEIGNEIIQNYIDGIDNCIESNNPVFGVQKTTSSTRIIDALKETSIDNEKLKWSSDGTLFNSALSNDLENKTTISHTPWYIEHKMDTGNKLVTPFEDHKGVNFEFGTYEDYKRAYFYAKPPTQTTVYRIGTPLIMFNLFDKNTLRDIAMNEMIKQFKEPLPVVVADNKVRIPKNLREKFRNLITLDPHYGTNEQRNYD